MFDNMTTLQISLFFYLFEVACVDYTLSFCNVRDFIIFILFFSSLAYLFQFISFIFTPSLLQWFVSKPLFSSLFSPSFIHTFYYLYHLFFSLPYLFYFISFIFNPSLLQWFLLKTLSSSLFSPSFIYTIDPVLFLSSSSRQSSQLFTNCLVCLSLHNPDSCLHS